MKRKEFSIDEEVEERREMLGERKKWKEKNKNDESLLDGMEANQRSLWNNLKNNIVVKGIAIGAGGLGLILSAVESDAVRTARHRCDVSSEICCPSAKARRRIRNWLHASV